MHHHKKLQRRVIIGAVIFTVLAGLIGVPLMVNDGLRYDIAMQTNSIPGRGAEKIATGDDGALLIVLPLENIGNAISPWLYDAQFIAWPSDGDYELENLETGERANLPLSGIEFTAASNDGSIVLMRGPHTDSGVEVAVTISTESMQVEQLPDVDSVPNAPGDWDISVWSKVEGICNRPSPQKQFVACFNRADLASYFAGDWQLDLQVWGDYETTIPLFRGMGFLPMVGFVHNADTVYWQNENGIWRMEVPQDFVELAPTASPLGTPLATPGT